MSQTQALKVRLALLCVLAGVVLALVAVVTDHWAVLSPRAEPRRNASCQAAHFGLWRICTRRIDPGDGRDSSCGPIALPAAPEAAREKSTASILNHQQQSHTPEKNCSYFRHFNPGESSEIFEVTTQKEYSISAAAIAIFSLGFVIAGTICALLSFGKTRDYLLRPAAMFYAFAGLCIFVSVEVTRQSVKRMIDSEDTVWIKYHYSWSFACACAAFVLLFLGGLALLLFSLPRMPQNPWESCMDAEPEH
ncbi:voltage-dependent calcium channel gamma-1 subunit isoform X1 [Physeter macrocephalus]|uniref:Voltage-dependent calcium channel gamma-1 subunit isoform X1 n=1 Tax=Physeter macrocephalus TaxID=9755 RepID=A0A455BZ94_PHYMC|nr:voltage-dependent calcium channel gamma-1 subunit isoform X1 [Physeter catodon]|eukprot:XP_028354369.1 voltage-dependent calcium channel gamma-1 subunit isoform X1 [Physeter catodon]